jgi:hypothetical protein
MGGLKQSRRWSLQTDVVANGGNSSMVFRTRVFAARPRVGNCAVPDKRQRGFVCAAYRFVMSSVFLRRGNNNPVRASGGFIQKVVKSNIYVEDFKPFRRTIYKANLQKVLDDRAQNPIISLSLAIRL